MAKDFTLPEKGELDTPTQPTESKGKGRPTKYTPELAATICAELSQGRSLRTICKAKDMPAASSVFLWLQKYPEFSEQYMRAKRESADAMAEDILYISDTPVMGEIRTVRPDGSVEIRQDEMLGHRRLQIDTRRWLMGKMKPKVYGDKVDVTSDGKALPTPIITLPSKD